MTATVFAGPSLAGLAPEAVAGLTLLPPAGQGDVYRALRQNPRAIGIVDGYFEGVPSVWHKEILFALSRGVAVYGAASIGALRAAELHVHGMIGVGEIFAAYCAGELEADDEVALQHGPAETGYIPLTEPLVNVRATCRAAEAAGIVSTDEAGAIVASARAIFYKERTWKDIVAGTRGAGAVQGPRLATFESWLRHGAVDQKRIDALSLIERLRSEPAAEPHEKPAPDFEPTFLWERAVSGWTRSPAGTPPAENDLEASILDQLRLEPARYRALKMRARLRLEALRDSETDPPQIAGVDRAAIRKRHRAAHNLYRSAELDRWLRGQHLDRAEYDRLTGETAIAEIRGASETSELHREMIVLMKLDGLFGEAAERATAKTAALTKRRIAPRPAPPILLDWFFRTRLREDAPDDIDALIRDLGLPSREGFYGLLAAEYLYSAVSGEDKA